MNLELSKQKAVNILRILYPLWAIIGMFSLAYVPSNIIVFGDAILTASNIMSNELLFRAGIVGSLVTQLIHIVVVLVVYQLFKSVDKNLSTLVVILGLVGLPIAMLNEIFNIAALHLVNMPDQMMFFLNLNVHGIFIAAFFWGLWLIPQGILIYKSCYFPKFFAYSMVIAGIAYFIWSFVNLLVPSFILLIEILNILNLGEVLFMLWVLFRGAKLKE